MIRGFLLVGLTGGIATGKSFDEVIHRDNLVMWGPEMAPHTPPTFGSAPA